MHNIITNFDQILDFAKGMNISTDRKRGILREYLQSKFITIFYSLSKSHKLALSGDSSLRLLKNIDRFSEDLCFTNLGILDDDVASIFYEVVKRFNFEGLTAELILPTKEWRSIDLLKSNQQLNIEKTYFDIRFSGLLSKLDITNNPNEILSIRISYESSWIGIKTENILFNKYGFIESVLSVDINQLLVQKLFLYTKGNSVQPKDIYDIVWLYSQGAKVDKDFAKVNLLENIALQAKYKYTLGNIPESFKNKLAPYLFNFNDVKKLDLFGLVLEELCK